MSIVAGDFVMETWFYFLIGAIVLFKVIVIGGIIYVRRNNIFAKKSALPNIYGECDVMFKAMHEIIKRHVNCISQSVSM